MIKRSKRFTRVQAALFAVLLGLFFGSLPAQAQNANEGTKDPLRADVLGRVRKSSLGDLTEGAAYEGVIDRDQYMVGPGDKLMLQVWSPAYEEAPLLVSGDGRVSVPYAGPVVVAGKTLAQVEQAIAEVFDQALRRGRISVSLLEPRRFRVHVTGQVMLPGTYTVRATARVADAIELAGGVKLRADLLSGDTVLTADAGLRRVEMRRAQDGSTVPVDLLRFYQGGDLAGNPPLLDGAVLYVPPVSKGTQVGVFGEVRLPGLYDSAPDESIATLLGVAGGLTGLADSNALSLQRAGGSLFELNWDDATLQTPVQAGDRLYVGGRPLSKALGSATVAGEVTRPGGYTIEPGVTTVSKLLEQVGGLLSTAEPRSARLVRSKPDLIETERRRVTMHPLPMMSKDDPAMLADRELSAELARWDYSTVVLDLSAKSGEPGWSGDVVLEDGDRLEIPSQPLGVRVLGYVNNAGEVPWADGKSLSYYIAQADGKNAAGWLGRTVIIKARNGSQLRYSNRVTIDPGDVLFVPQRPRTTGWERVKDIITVVTQVATIVLVVDSASK